MKPITYCLTLLLLLNSIFHVQAEIVNPETYCFKDLTGTMLKPEIKLSDIDHIKTPALKLLAIRLYKKTYQPASRLVTIEPYLNPATLGRQRRIGNGYSPFEGITGIYLEKGENLVLVGKTNGAKLKLLVPDWTEKRPVFDQKNVNNSAFSLHKEVFSLNEGLNVINLKTGGNVYIQYFTDGDPKTLSPIMVHFPTGMINGYFDLTRGDTNEDFNKLLENAVGPIMDIRGKHIQLAFPVDSLKKYTLNQGVELVRKYDTIVGLQQHMLGWDKEGIVPKNHILARVNYYFYMYRDGDGMAFINWAMKLVANSDNFKNDPCWGFCHEMGHVHQMCPQMSWGGMSEVSNNILTMYAHIAVGNQSRLSQEHQYAKARATILDKGISYMDFPGKLDPSKTNVYGGTGNTDVFQRLVPFWQLYLYFKEQGYPDFYPDLLIAMRNQKPIYGGPDRGKDYLNMLEFCRLACVVSKTDLTEFFQRWGFFYVGEIDLADYTPIVYHVSQSDVDIAKEAIAKLHLPKPVKDITLIED